VSDYLATSELDALRITREIVASIALTLPKRGTLPRANIMSQPRFVLISCERCTHVIKRLIAPVLDASQLLGIAGADIRVPYDVREVIARIVDQVTRRVCCDSSWHECALQSRMHEFKERYGTTMVCVLARIHGIDVGILGNNGELWARHRAFTLVCLQVCCSVKQR
jgi:acetyl-CoA carboxylase carboxyltransferase component